MIFRIENLSLQIFVRYPCHAMPCLAFSDAIPIPVPIVSHPNFTAYSKAIAAKPIIPAIAFIVGMLPAPEKTELTAGAVLNGATVTEAIVVTRASVVFETTGFVVVATGAAVVVGAWICPSEIWEIGAAFDVAVGA